VVERSGNNENSNSEHDIKTCSVHFYEFSEFNDSFQFNSLSEYTFKLQKRVLVEIT